MNLQNVCRRMRGGLVVSDEEFDQHLPIAAQFSSPRWWTEVSVARQVSRWLSELGASSVLDVGAGVGKFCIVGALSSRLVFTGVEQRAHLVDVARGLADRAGVSDRAAFVHGDFGLMDFKTYDALYFYNPFGENLFPTVFQLDSAVELTPRKFERDRAKTTEGLRRMLAGSHVVTFNGCGAGIPDSYELMRREEINGKALRLWRKTRVDEGGRCWLEREMHEVQR